MGVGEQGVVSRGTVWQSLGALDLVKLCGYFPRDFSMCSLSRGFQEEEGGIIEFSLFFFSVISNIKPFWGHEFTGQVCVENILGQLSSAFRTFNNSNFRV